MWCRYRGKLEERKYFSIIKSEAISSIVDVLASSALSHDQNERRWPGREEAAAATAAAEAATATAGDPSKLVPIVLLVREGGPSPAGLSRGATGRVVWLLRGGGTTRRDAPKRQPRKRSSCHPRHQPFSCCRKNQQPFHWCLRNRQPFQRCWRNQQHHQLHHRCRRSRQHHRPGMLPARHCPVSPPLPWPVITCLPLPGVTGPPLPELTLVGQWKPLSSAQNFNRDMWDFKGGGGRSKCISFSHNPSKLSLRFYHALQQKPNV
ncbi:UNVERIFIED_CONTAM: hypothetical protein FKN15_035052 [Acipenser sinensis]